MLIQGVSAFACLIRSIPCRTFDIQIQECLRDGRFSGTINFHLDWSVMKFRGALIRRG